MCVTTCSHCACTCTLACLCQARFLHACFSLQYRMNPFNGEPAVESFPKSVADTSEERSVHDSLNSFHWSLFYLLIYIGRQHFYLRTLKLLGEYSYTHRVAQHNAWIPCEAECLPKYPLVLFLQKLYLCKTLILDKYM